MIQNMRLSNGYLFNKKLNMKLFLFHMWILRLFIEFD